MLLALLAFAITVSLQLPQYGSTYLLLYPAVFLAAYFAGRDAGFAATATGAAAVAVRIVVGWDEQPAVLIQFASLVLFVGIGFGVTMLMSRLKGIMRELEDSNLQLLEANETARLASEETDLLLRELRHRIRNDLSNVIAVLRLQAKTANQEAAEHLQTAAERLHVLAKVHQRLSRQGHSPVVEMKGFIEELCSELRATLLALKPVALETDLDEIRLGSARAVSVGLIVNELVTNAIKYAYPDDREGTICVYLTCDEEVVEIGVEDDGIGTDVEQSEAGTGLGHRLVRSLSAQLGGRFLCSVDPPGMSCIVTFPRNPPSIRRDPLPE